MSPRRNRDWPSADPRQSEIGCSSCDPRHLPGVLFLPVVRGSAILCCPTALRCILEVWYGLEIDPPGSAVAAGSAARCAARGPASSRRGRLGSALQLGHGPRRAAQSRQVQAAPDGADCSLERRGSRIDLLGPHRPADRTRGNSADDPSLEGASAKRGLGPRRRSGRFHHSGGDRYLPLGRGRVFRCHPHAGGSGAAGWRRGGMPVVPFQRKDPLPPDSGGWVGRVNRRPAGGVFPLRLGAADRSGGSPRPGRGLSRRQVPDGRNRDWVPRAVGRFGWDGSQGAPGPEPRSSIGWLRCGPHRTAVVRMAGRPALHPGLGRSPGRGKPGSGSSGAGPAVPAGQPVYRRAGALCGPGIPEPGHRVERG